MTVDPERDTPARLGDYASRFNTGVTPLTGSNEELERIKGIFGVVAETLPAPNSAAGYFVDHTGSILLLDRESRISLIYQFGTDDALIVDDLKRIVPPRWWPGSAPRQESPTLPVGTTCSALLWRRLPASPRAPSMPGRVPG